MKSQLFILKCCGFNMYKTVRKWCKMWERLIEVILLQGMYVIWSPSERLSLSHFFLSNTIACKYLVSKHLHYLCLYNSIVTLPLALPVEKSILYIIRFCVAISWSCSCMREKWSMRSICGLARHLQWCERCTGLSWWRGRWAERWSSYIYFLIYILTFIYAYLLILGRERKNKILDTSNQNKFSRLGIRALPQPRIILCDYRHLRPLLSLWK